MGEKKVIFHRLPFKSEVFGRDGKQKRPVLSVGLTLGLRKRKQSEKTRVRVEPVAELF